MTIAPFSINCRLRFGVCIRWQETTPQFQLTVQWTRTTFCNSAFYIYVYSYIMVVHIINLFGNFFKRMNGWYRTGTAILLKGPNYPAGGCNQHIITLHKRHVVHCKRWRMYHIIFGKESFNWLFNEKNTVPERWQIG